MAENQQKYNSVSCKVYDSDLFNSNSSLYNSTQIYKKSPQNDLKKINNDSNDSKKLNNKTKNIINNNNNNNNIKKKHGNVVKKVALWNNLINSA
jgi:hypothetical protein